jgi:hypothetical protein
MLSEQALEGLEPELERKLSSYWPSAFEQAEARRLLGTYGEAQHELEVARVQLALLKLSAGSLDELSTVTAVAKTDYRDVLAWAEYPEQSRAAWSFHPNLSEAERRELRDMRARDRAQYEAWLAR